MLIQMLLHAGYQTGQLVSGADVEIHTTVAIYLVDIDPPVTVDVLDHVSAPTADYAAKLDLSQDTADLIVNTY